MRNFLRSIDKIFLQFGFDPKTFLTSVRGLPFFIRDLCHYKSMVKISPNAIPLGTIYPILHERFKPSGEALGHYFYQDLWAARKIYNANPMHHLDIGSSIRGFVSSLLVFREVEVVDIRPLTSQVQGLHFLQSDATTLKEFAMNSLESISTLHAGEHFGLGRYGDPIDPDAHYKFMKSLSRVLQPGGKLYFSVPSGKEKLYFNAHRVLAPQTVMAAFQDLQLVSFSCVKDDGKFYENCSLDEVSQEYFGCGLYEFTKR